MEGRKKRAMISQLMSGKTDEEILETRDKAKAELESLGYEVIDTFLSGEEWKDEALKAAGVKNIPVFMLAESIKRLSQCDAIYFCKGFEHGRGCRIEQSVAVKYGLERIYEDNKYSEYDEAGL